MKFALRADIIRRKWPPRGGWIYHELATGWVAPSPMSDNFDTTVEKIIRHRAANRAYGLSVDPVDVQVELMDQTAQRIIREAPEHAAAWVVPLDEEAKKKSPGQTDQGQRSRGAGVVARHAGPSAVERLLSRVRGIARGAATLADWIGDGAEPVSESVADVRASICAQCSLNRPKEDFSEVVTSEIAEAIYNQTIVKNALGRSTKSEDKLGMCDACGCPLRLKVWVPIGTIRARTDQTTMDAFAPGCWIRSERQTSSSAGTRRPVSKRVVTIQRRAAFGDVIMASVLASKLADQGYGIRFITEPVIAKALAGHPHVQEWVSEGAFDVNLDRTYEDNLERKRRPAVELFLEAAEHQLRAMGIEKNWDTSNLVPYLGIEAEERFDALSELQKYPRPWVLVVDGSAAWPNRQWGRPHVEGFPKMMGKDATLIWSKAEQWNPRPAGYSTISINSFRRLMAITSQVDMVITTDTGPLHVAAAFNRPIIAIEQNIPIALRLTNQTDWLSASAPLQCIGCNEMKCPIEGAVPPCQSVDAAVIAALTNARWRTYSGSDASAIIPVLSETPRLERCIAAVRGQVSEVIVALDGKATVSDRIKAMGVRVIPAPGVRTGYGKTIMRAARVSHGRFLLPLNDDCFLDPTAVAEMKACMDSRTAVVGGLLRYPNGKIQHGGMHRPPGVFGFGHIDHNQKTPSIRQPCEMEAVTFAAALVRREAFFQVRGFDERYDCYSEDADLCMTLHAAGWRVVYTPFATGVHDESQTTSSQKQAMLAAGNALFASKWGPYLRAKKPIF